MKAIITFLSTLVLTGVALNSTALGQAQPSIKITSPPDGSSLLYGSNLPLAALVVDTAGTVNQVTYSFAYTVAGTTTPPASLTATAAPYLINTSVPNPYAVESGSTPIGAPLTITATATDSTGATFTDTVTITAASATEELILKLIDTLEQVLSVDGFGTEPPTSPFAGLHLAAGSTITLTAAFPSAADGSFNDVNLYVDGDVIASFDGGGNMMTSAHGVGPVRESAMSDTSDVPFSATYTLPEAKSFMNLVSGGFTALGFGALSQGSTFDTVVADHPSPQVEISNVAPGTVVTVGSSSQIVVTATPQAAAGAVPVPVQTVKYFANGIEVSGSASAPYGFDFQPTSAGKKILYAVATDTSGLSAVSDPVAMEVVGPVVHLVTGGDGTAVVGGKNAEIFVERTDGLSQTLTVNYKAKGTAVANVDYKALSGRVTLAAGVSKAKIKVTPLSTETVAGTRTLKVKLLPSTDGSYTLGTDSVVKVKVIEED